MCRRCLPFWMFLRLDLLFSPYLLRRSRDKLKRFLSSGFLTVLTTDSPPFLTGSLPEAVVPNPRRADQIRIVSQRRESQFRFLRRHESAAASNHCADSVEKQRRAFHHTAAQNDRIRSEEINQIREPKAEVKRLVLDGLESDGITLLRQFADFLCSDAFAMRIVRGRVAVDPRHHGRASGQRLPAPVKAARTRRACGIEHLMPNFRMSAVDAAVQFAVENHSTANARANGHVDQPRTISARAPSGFGESGSVAIVFERNAHLENLRQIAHWTFPAPSREKIHIAKLAAHGVDRPRRSDSDSSQLDAGALHDLAQHARDQLDTAGIILWIGRRLSPRKHDSVIVDHANRNFCPTNVDRSDHANSGFMAFASSSVIRFLFL